jgi:hypothetical protein
VHDNLLVPVKETALFLFERVDRDNVLVGQLGGDLNFKPESRYQASSWGKFGTLMATKP